MPYENLRTLVGQCQCQPDFNHPQRILKAVHSKHRHMVYFSLFNTNNIFVYVFIVCVCVPAHLCLYLNLSMTQESVFKEFFLNVFPGLLFFSDLLSNIHLKLKAAVQAAFSLTLPSDARDGNAQELLR